MRRVKRLACVDETSQNWNLSLVRSATLVVPPTASGFWGVASSGFCDDTLLEQLCSERHFTISRRELLSSDASTLSSMRGMKFGQQTQQPRDASVHQGSLGDDSMNGRWFALDWQLERRQPQHYCMLQHKSPRQHRQQIGVRQVHQRHHK